MIGAIDITAVVNSTCEGAGARAVVRRIEASPSFLEQFGRPSEQVLTLDHSLGRVLPIARKMTQPATVSITDRNGQAHECVAEAFDTTFHVLVLVYPGQSAESLGRDTIKPVYTLPGRRGYTHAVCLEAARLFERRAASDLVKALSAGPMKVLSTGPGSFRPGQGLHSSVQRRGTFGRNTLRIDHTLPTPWLFDRMYHGIDPATAQRNRRHRTIVGIVAPNRTHRNESATSTSRRRTRPCRRVEHDVAASGSCSIQSTVIELSIVENSGFSEIGSMPACSSGQGGSHRRGGA